MSNELEKKEENVDEKAMQAIMDSFGTSKPNVADYLVNTSIKGILPPSKQSDKNIKAVFSLIKEMDAQNPIEGMLYTQMIACHTQAMNLFKLGNDAYDHNVAQKFLGMADRFMRTYNKSLETLERFKRGGKQHVIVENVVVNSGGQAIVGSVNPNRGVK
jgi:lipoate synthase